MSDYAMPERAVAPEEQIWSIMMDPKAAAELLDEPSGLSPNPCAKALHWTARVITDAVGKAVDPSPHEAATPGFLMALKPQRARQDSNPRPAA
jgi:hypothetical protein